MAAEEDDNVLQFGRLNTVGIEKFREKVGLDWPYNRWTTWNEEATLDGIRHYAYGFGDDNPLWVDPEYAGTTRWGGVIAPPGYLEGAGLTPKLAPVPDARGRGRGGLSGVHMYWAGDHTTYFRAVHHGDRIWVRRFYVDISEKTSSRFGGRSALSVRRRVYWNQHGELIAVWDADFVHAERHRSGSSEGRPQFPPTTTPTRSWRWWTSTTPQRRYGARTSATSRMSIPVTTSVRDTEARW